MIPELRTFNTSIQAIMFNNGSNNYHCPNNRFQSLKYKHWSLYIGNCKSEHWTCLVCSDKSTVSSAEIQYCSSISVGPRDPSLLNTITSKSTVYVSNTTARVKHLPTVTSSSNEVQYKSTVYHLDIISIISQRSYCCQAS